MEKTKALILLLVMNISLFAQGDWNWVNPYPQGNRLNDVSILSPNEMVAVGNAGTILKSFDGGQSWMVENNVLGITGALSSVSFVDENNGWTVGVAGDFSFSDAVLLKTTDKSLNWTIHYTMPFSVFNTVRFLNLNTGFILGENLVEKFILKTQNGGASWDTTYTTAPFNDLSSLFFLDTNTGWTIGDFGQPPQILKTVDGGETWSSIMANGLNLGADWVQFVTDEIGWAASKSYRLLYKTTDGGSNWIEQNSGASIWTGYFLNADTGWSVGNGESIWQTIDGGDSWSPHSIENTRGINALSFGDSNTAYGVGVAGTIINTTNAGQTWDVKSTGVMDDLYAIEFIQPDKIWIVGHAGGIHFSTDQGSNWQRQLANTTASLNSVDFINMDNGWVVGSNGTILFTNDGGNIWTLQPSGTTEFLSEVLFVNSSTGWIVGDAGLVLKTTDQGNSWFQITVPTTENLYSIFFLGENWGWIVGSQIILHTTDGGGSWNSVQVGFPLDDLYDIFFFDQLNGWAIGRSPIVLHTTDGGSSWEQQTHPGESDEMWAIQFSDHMTGLAVGNGGVCVSSTNGGADWEISLARTGEDLWDVASVGGEAWVVGDDGNILKSSIITSITADPLNSIENIFLESYPNPFNPSVTIHYTLPTASHVILTVFDILGREVKILVNQSQSGGSYNVVWDGRDAQDQTVASGTYIYQLKAGNNIANRKMLLVR